MKHRKALVAYRTLASFLVFAMLLMFVPGWAVAQAPAQAAAPTGICVNGQVIDKNHVGIGPGIQVAASLNGQPGVTVETDAKGNFALKDLQPGLWTFRVTIPDSWEAVTAQEFQAELGFGHSGCYVIRFKLNPLGCILVKKTDVDGKPVVDWLVRVSGPIDPEMKTDANGEAKFTKLVPGTYVVSETVPYPWKALTPTSSVVKVHAAMDDNDCTVVEFKNERQPTSCVTGTKVDDQHKPLADWTIYAQRTDGKSPVFMQQTAADGSFTFKDLTLGQWTIWETVPAGWTPVTPAKFTVTLGTPSAPPECVQVRFKNRPPDVCADGYKVDEHGKGLAGWTITAQSEADPTLSMTTVTDAHGYYRFNGLTLGNWVFTEEHKTGWTALTPDMFKVNITATKFCTRVPTFRNQSPRGCIDGYKRDDLQVGLPGWKVWLKPVGGGTAVSATTDGTGYFKFGNLPVGKYEVWEELQPGWIPMTPTKGVYEVVASDDPACVPVEFINKQKPRDICIDGYKLDYYNQKVGLPGWPVTLKNLVTGVELTTTTDGLGYFRFSNLDPGRYQVKVTEQAGWLPVGPLVKEVTVSWPPKLECTTVKFYDRQKGQPPPPPPPPPPPNGCAYWHIVRPGQTLSGLAAFYRVSMADIMRLNKIANPDKIYIGQKLCIPPDP